MGLVQQLAGYIRGPSRMSEAIYTKAKPLRNPEAEQSTDEEGNTVLKFAVAHDKRPITRIVDKLSKTRHYREFVLEPIGARVWGMCDGKTTVKTISRKLSTEFKMSGIEADTALGQYLHTLSQRGLITMLVPKK